MLANTGVPTEADLASVLPSPERLAKGPVAVIECFQNIPCDPCYWSCGRGAIKEFRNITELPKIDPDKCNGCSLCVAYCPGLAIFVVDCSYDEDKAIVRIPYEYLPLPSVGSKVIGLDRGGGEICPVTVHKIQRFKGKESTVILWLVVPKEYVMTIRNVKVGGGGNACKDHCLPL